MKLNKVKEVNGEKVINAMASSEHKLFQGKYYGYACIETEKKCYYVPTDLNKNLVLNEKIWDFIKEIPTIK